MQGNTSRCVLSIRTFSQRTRLPVLRELVEVKDITVPFMKSRRAIAGVLNKITNPDWTYRGHCISGTATHLDELMLTHSHVLHMNVNH